MKKFPWSRVVLASAAVTGAALFAHCLFLEEGAEAPGAAGTKPQAPLEGALHPRKVLPANAAMVDFLSFLVGAERVAAVPAAAGSYSRLLELGEDWAELPTFQGYSAEIVLALEPDLLLVHAWQSPETTELVRSSGIPVLISPLPRSWADVLETIVELGRVLGVESRADELTDELERRREALLARPFAARGLSALSYSNLGAGGTAAGAGTTADVLFELTGLTNAAAEHGMRGHASLDHERLLAIDPDLFVVGMLEDEGELPPSATYLLEQPDLAGLEAVRAGRVLALPPRLFTTASPELMRAAEVLADEVERALAVAEGAE